MARHGQQSSSTLLSRWLSTGPREEAPVRPAPAPAAAAQTRDAPAEAPPERTARDVLRELEASIAARLDADHAALLSAQLDPIRAALEPGAKVDPDGLVKVFEQVEDLLEAFLLAAEGRGDA